MKPFFIWQHTSVRKVFLFQKYTSVLKTRIVIARRFRRYPLFNAIEKGRATSVFSEEEKEMLCKTIRLLPSIQFAGADGFDFSHCYPQAEFNQRSILWDLNYFKYCFLKATGLEFKKTKLEDDKKMSDVLLRSSSATLCIGISKQKRDDKGWSTLVH